MFRRSCGSFFARSAQKKAVWPVPERVAQANMTKKPLFAPAPVHLYSSKDRAFEAYHNEEKGYTMFRFKLFFRRMWSEKGARWYLTFMLTAIPVGGLILWKQQEQTYLRDGLIGPKKKFYKSRLTVVLDVDETIVSYGDKAFRLRAGMVARPYLAELLDYLSSIDAEVILWSACSERYMKQVLQAIDPNGVRVSQYIIRDRTWFTNDNWYEKNLRWLNRPMDDILFIENRPYSVRSCNNNAILVPDFIRGEYMENGQDWPANDQAMRRVREVVQDLEESGLPVEAYLHNKKKRNKDIQEIPCHLAMRQLPDEIAVGNFFFVGDKYKAGGMITRQYAE